MNGTIWRRRKRGSPRQRGKPFPVKIGRPVLHSPRMKIYRIESTNGQKLVRPTSVDFVLSSLSLMFPQLLPIIEGGRLILSNRKFFLPFVRTLFSNKSNQQKIKAIERGLQEGIERKAIPEFSAASSRAISELMRQQIGFDTIAKLIDQSSGRTDPNVFQLFFENTLEKFIQESALKVLSNVTR